MKGDWKNRKIRWQAVLCVAAGIILFSCLLFIGQSRDMNMLKETYDALRDAQLVLQNERSDKQRELAMVDSPEYLAGRARENGYLRPDEIRFIITNVDDLLENGAETEAEIVEEGL